MKPISLFPPSRHLHYPFALCFLTTAAIAGPLPDVAVSFDANGLSSLRCDNAEMIAPNCLPAASALNDQGKMSPLPPAKVVVAGSTESIVFDGLKVTVEYRPAAGNLEFTATFENTGAAPLKKVDFRPFSIQWPARPQGKPWTLGYEKSVDADGAPGVVSATWSTGKVALCLLPDSDAQPADADCPITLGFGGAQPPKFISAVFFRPTFDPPLAPGGKWTMRGALHFSSPGTPDRKMAAEAYEAFLRKYPPALNWPDRRPIGSIFLANSARNWPTNPRGWFSDQNLDVNTPEGRAIFRQRLMKLADACIANLRDIGAQGMIFWDVEGGEKPHAITYLGDPRALPEFAPEMDAVADEFFKKFIDAGFRTGICIRPSKIVLDPKKGGPKHQQTDDPIANMSEKIDYARKRWGCTIFYMDTNVLWPLKDLSTGDTSRGMWQGDSVVIPSREMVRLTKMHPDALIFPEYARLGYFSSTSVYGEPRPGKAQTSADTRDAYPQAFTVWKLGDTIDFPSYWDTMLAAAVAGDIQCFPSWFGDPTNQLVKLMRVEVDYIARAGTVKPADFATQVGDHDPLVRFVAVKALEKPDAAQSALLIDAVAREPDWVVQRRMVEALGRSGSPAAVPGLETLASDPKCNLFPAATTALGRLGAPGTPSLITLARNPTPRIARAALRALALNDDPAATSFLLEATRTGKPVDQALAAAALAKRSGDEARARVLELLSGNQPEILIALCKALGEARDKQVVPPLVDLIVRSATTLKNNTVREAAGDALEAITTQTYGTFETQWKKALDEGRL